MIEKSDYYSRSHSLVLGFHGCDQSIATAVLEGSKDLIESKNDYDWLGRGVYFWERDYERALSWAREQQSRDRIQSPAVVGAIIDLGYCLDLLESRAAQLLKDEYEFLKDEYDEAGEDLPRNRGLSPDNVMRYLDYAVVEHLMDRLAHPIDIDDSSAVDSSSPRRTFDTVRGVFEEGNPIYEGAGFREKTHIQIAIRNPNCILGYFKPRTPDLSKMLPWD